MMSREIKFRAWQKKYKCMWYDGGHMDLCLTLDGHLYTPDSYYGYHHDSDFILMQFTGLHDATRWEQLTEYEKNQWLSSGKTAEEWNGKEIYEGDICDWQEGNNTERYEVRFDNAMFWYKSFTDGEYSAPLAFINPDSLKVIGNIYNNPELSGGE